MNKVDLFPVLTAPCLLIFLSNLSKIDKVVVVATLDQTLTKGTARSISAFITYHIT